MCGGVGGGSRETEREEGREERRDWGGADLLFSGTVTHTHTHRKKLTITQASGLPFNMTASFAAAFKSCGSGSREKEAAEATR